MEYFDIFLGGPMGDKSDDGAGVSFDQHLSNLAKATHAIAKKIHSEHSRFNIRVLNPDVQDVGTISERVFSMIDRAELGLVDVSAASQSVMYEVAFLHALGTPVIPITIKPKKPDDTQHVRKPSFYLKQEYIAVVSDFKVETLTKALEPKIRSVLGLDSVFPNQASNPITNYYGLPLMDVSATTGLATGYFHNFLRHVIKETNSVFQMKSELKKLVILYPDTLNEVAGMNQTVKTGLQERGLEVEMVDEKDGRVYEEKDQVRGQVLLSSVGEYIFDVPAPLNAQKSSPRHIKLLDQIKNARGAHRKDLEDLRFRLERNMVEQFFDVLSGLIHQPELNPDRVEFLTVDGFLSRL